MIKKISLYTPCLNAKKTIAKCIEAVLRQTYPIEEIIIVDDGSSDNTALVASKYNVRIIQHKVNMGLAASRNTGVLNSRNEYIASLDADCIPSPDWVEKLIENFTFDNIAGAGGQLIEVNLTTLADKWRANHLVQSWGSKPIVNPRHLFGNNTIFKKSAIVEVGLYNPKYKTNAEDYDISQRLIKSGYTLIYNPLAKVRHVRSDNIYSVMNTYSKYYYFGYTKKINTINMIRGILVNLYFSTSFFIKDLLHWKINLLSLDIISFIFAVYKNICRAILY